AADSALFDYVLVHSGLGPETMKWFAPLPSSLAQLVLRYVGRPSGYTSMQAFFEAASDARFCLTLFDGNRLHVQDWDAIWTRSSIVDVDRVVMPFDRCDYQKKRAKLWVRTIHRVSKYRDRNFNIELRGDTSSLFTSNLDGELLQKRRRHSFASSSLLRDH